MCRDREREVAAEMELASAVNAVDSTIRGASSPPPISEESADSELWTSDAALSCPGGVDQDDDDAESCNCASHGSGGGGGGGYESSDDGGGDGPPVSWWERFVRNAAGRERVGEEVERGEEEEVASVKPVAGVEDRLFWEACLAHGYP